MEEIDIVLGNKEKKRHCKICRKISKTKRIRKK